MENKTKILFFSVFLLALVLVLSGCGSEGGKAQVAEDEDDGKIEIEEEPEEPQTRVLVYKHGEVSAEVDGSAKQYATDDEMGYASGLTTVNGASEDMTEGFHIIFPGKSTGTFYTKNEDVQIRYIGPAGRYSADEMYSGFGADGVVIVSEYGNVIRGTFSGKLVNNGNPTGGDTVEVVGGEFLVSDRIV